MKYKKLSEVCTLINGRAYKQDELLDSGKYPVLRVGNFFSDKGYYFSDLELEENKYCDKGDLLFAWSASFGPKIWKGRKAIYHYHIWKIVLTDLIDKEYLFFYLQFISNEVKSAGHGAVMIHTTKAEMEQRLIPLSSLEEQRSIATVLSKVETILDRRKQQLSELDTLIKARFVEMFGNLVYNTNNLSLRTLNELGNWNSGGTPSRTNPTYFTGNIDWYSAGELNTLYLDGSIEKITEDAINESSAKLFKAGSMLVGMYDTAAFKMGILKKDSASNQACACIEPNELVNIVWLYYTLQLMKEHFLSQRRGVRQKNLNLGMIKNFKIPVADRGQQDEFVSFAAQVDKLRVATQKSLDKTQELFDCLMQEYFG